MVRGADLGAGAGPVEHALRAAGVSALLRNPSCQSFSSQLRVRSAVTGLATYADAAVVCGRFEAHPEDKDACTNPVVLVEVLSPSTEAYDRGEKFEHYTTFASLRDYVLVATGRNDVDHYSRNADGSFTRRGYGPGERFQLSSVAVTLDVDALYEGVEEVRTAAPTLR